jgi:hypothetical protein
MSRWLARVRSFGGDAEGAARFVRLITGVPVRSDVLGTPGHPRHPEDVPRAIGHVATAWWDASTGGVLAILAFDESGQAALVDRAMRSGPRGAGGPRYGCVVMALFREAAAGYVVAPSSVTVDLVAYAGAAGTVLRPLATDEHVMAHASVDT